MLVYDVCYFMYYVISYMSKPQVKFSYLYCQFNPKLLKQLNCARRKDMISASSKQSQIPIYLDFPCEGRLAM